MRYLKIQIISPLDEKNLKQYINIIIENWLNSTIEINLGDKKELKETILSMYEIVYSVKSGENNIYGVIFQPFEYLEEENEKKYINDFFDQLLDREKVLYIFKFFDSSAVLLYQTIFKNIYDIESKLREIISCIFYSTYPDKFFKTLEAHQVGVQPAFSDRTEEDKRKFFENEFHYLIFSDYKKIKDLKEIKNIQQIINIILNKNSFEEFKKELDKQGIKNQLYIDFLDKIRDKLDSIEKVRNCVMHSRTISESLSENFNKAISEIAPIIEEFWIKIGSVCPKCGSEMFIQRGARGKFWSCTKWSNCDGSKSIE